MNGRNEGLGGAELGRVRPLESEELQAGHAFFERRMATGDESEWTRWHEDGRWADARHDGRTWEARGLASAERGPSGSEGPYRGKGPRGYQRSQERFRELVCEVLARDGHVDASDIEVQIDENNEVILLGTVADRAQKRRAEELVDRVDGVRDVHNQLRLMPVGR